MIKSTLHPAGPHWGLVNDHFTTDIAFRAEYSKAVYSVLTVRTVRVFPAHCAQCRCCCAAVAVARPTFVLSEENRPAAASRADVNFERTSFRIRP